MTKTLCKKWNQKMRLTTFLVDMNTDYWLIGFSKRENCYMNCKEFVLCILCFRFRWSWRNEASK